MELLWLLPATLLYSVAFGILCIFQPPGTTFAQRLWMDLPEHPYALLLGMVVLFITGLACQFQAVVSFGGPEEMLSVGRAAAFMASLLFPLLLGVFAGTFFTRGICRRIRLHCRYPVFD
ncbi:MAG: hypothetical protein Q8Q36_02445 [bacterium]|nr:hypothetical protein [bacterium]